MKSWRTILGHGGYEMCRWPLPACLAGTQKLQNPFIEEYTLNHNKDKLLLKESEHKDPPTT